ncbi:beta-1,3-galactosyltransferase 2-like [Arapaima gigas]
MVWSLPEEMVRIFLAKNLFLVFVVLFTFLVAFFWLSGKHAMSVQSLDPVAPEIYKLISPSTYKYVLNQPDKCRERRPFLVLVVPVAPDKRASRDAIRETWGWEDHIPNVGLLRIFFVGLPTGENHLSIQEDLERESEKHEDIVQMDFMDNYYNLTIKTMMIMNWLASSCQEASYAMKIDSDIFLNVDYLVNKLLVPNSTRKNYITGSVIKDGHPRRDKHSKWYMPEDVFPEDMYPPYVSGAGYVFSADLSKKISMASRFVRPIPFEDIYVGLCLRVLGVQPVYGFSLTSMHNLFEIYHLKYQRCTYYERVIVTGFQPDQLIQIWHDFQKAKFTC